MVEINADQWGEGDPLQRTAEAIILKPHSIAMPLGIVYYLRRGRGIHVYSNSMWVVKTQKRLPLFSIFFNKYQ